LSQADFPKNPVISFSVLRAKKDSQPFGWLSFLSAAAELLLHTLGYEADERSSLGERADRRRGRGEGGERVAAVGKKQARFAGRSFCRAPQQGRYAEPICENVCHKVME